MNNNNSSAEQQQQGQQQNPHYFSSTPYPDFDTLVKQVRDGSPELLQRPLEPDGYFQSRASTLSEINRVVTDLNKKILDTRSVDDLPTIIMAWGKCRVGSTALTNLFGIAGIPAYYNPIKTAVRQFLLDGPAKGWDVPSRSEYEFIFSKNMSGPYHLADCIVNPLQPLIEAGYPANRIELVVLEREPMRAFASWLQIWGRLIRPERLVQHYVLSALNSIRIKAYAKQVGIRTSHYIYEASRIPGKTIHALFHRLGLSKYYHEDVFENWNEKGALASNQSKIVFPEIPEVMAKIPMHASEGRYQYKERNTDRVIDEHKALIEQCGAIERYLDAAVSFAKEMQLDLHDCEKVFQGTLSAIPLNMESAEAKAGT